MKHLEIKKYLQLICLLLLTINAIGQPLKINMTKDEIIHKSWKAMFGAMKDEDLKTIYVEAFQNQSEIPNQIMVKRPNQFRNDVPDEGTLVFDGNRGAWLKKIDDQGKLLGPEILEAEVWMHFEVDIAIIFPAFFDFPSILKGISRVGNKDTYELFVSLPLGSTVTYFIDTEDFLIIKRLVSWEGNPEHYLYDHMIDGYINYDGMLYQSAYEYPRRAGKMTTHYKNVKFNLNLEDNLFAIPKELN